MKKNIFVALDFSSLKEALNISEKLRDYIAGVKVGTELYTICGAPGLKKLKDQLGLDIFLDFSFSINSLISSFFISANSEFSNTVLSRCFIA